MKGSEMEDGTPNLHYAFFGDNKEYDSISSKKKNLRLWRKQVLRFGIWKHPENPEIEFEVTPEVIRQVISNFHSGVPEEAPVVLTHTDNPLLKVGRVKQYEIGSDGLFAIFSVMDEAVNRKITASEETVPGVSCWLDLNYKDKQSGDELGAVIKHVALVNHPYIEGMAGFQAVLSEFDEESKMYLPLVLSEKEFVGKRSEKTMTKEELIKELKEKHQVDVETLLSDSEKLILLHKRISDGELVSKEDIVLNEELVKELKEKLQLSSEEKVNMTDAIKLLLKKIGGLPGLETRLRETESQLSEMKANKVIDALLSEGRALPAEREHFVSLFKTDEALFGKFIEARKKADPIVKLSETGVVGDDPTGDKKREQKEALDRNVEAAKKEGIALRA
jgi:hypothetical protein